MAKVCEHFNPNTKTCSLDYTRCRYIIESNFGEMDQCEQAKIWKANQKPLEQWRNEQANKKLITEDDYKTEIKRIIVTEVLAWNTENAQDLQGIVTKILDINDEGDLENYAIDKLAKIIPPSFINIKELNKLFPNDRDGVIETIYAIDKNLECYYLADGEIFNLNDAIDTYKDTTR